MINSAYSNFLDKIKSTHSSFESMSSIFPENMKSFEYQENGGKFKITYPKMIDSVNVSHSDPEWLPTLKGIKVKVGKVVEGKIISDQANNNVKIEITKGFKITTKFLPASLQLIAIETIIGQTLELTGAIGIGCLKKEMKGQVHANDLSHLKIMWKKA